MAGEQRPDIVVGIDIGQTCSGVAYSIGPDWSAPYTLNKWPSYDGFTKADKVSTRVAYDRRTEALRHWGFECRFDDPGLFVREQFKLTLDSEYEDDRGFNFHQARKWYLDYLKCLHRQIEAFFTERVPNWHNLSVEYSFSTPTTWRNPAIIAKVEELIKAAGFVSKGRQTVRMGLTEAEAAAIDAATTQYRAGDVFLICDAGGGTTDVNVLSVESVGDKTQLQPLDHVEGVPIGSTLIDYRMTQHIVERLQLIWNHLSGDPLYLAEEMLMGKFQTIKHSFPRPNVDQFWLDVKGLAGSQTFPQAGITDSKMAIHRETLREMFDQQIFQIFELIDDRLRCLQDEFPQKQVAYIILSGGFGSSDYLHEQLKRRYEMNEGFSSANTSSIRIMKALEPQLTVVKGLVRERTQQLGASASKGSNVFQSRRCRNSYGLAINQPYNPANPLHMNASTFKGKDGRMWVENLIDWFIMKGEVVNVTDGIRKPYGNTMAVNEHTQPRSARIVMSTRPIQQLPTRTTEAGCQSVASVKYTLTENDMKLMNKQFWKCKKKYWRASFFFVVKLGPADLRFQIVGENGILSSDHDKLSIEFMEGSEGSSDKPPQRFMARYY